VEPERVETLERPCEIVSRTSCIDAHADRPSDRSRITLLRVERRLESPENLAKAIVRLAEPCCVPRVAVARSQPQHSVALSRDEPRTPPPWCRHQPGAPHFVVPAVKAPGLPVQQRADDLQRFLEPADAVIGRVTERLVLRVEPACAETEDDAAAADLVGGHRH